MTLSRLLKLINGFDLSMNCCISLQYLLPHQAISWLAGKIAYNTWPPLKNLLIRWFIKKYEVDLTQAETPIPEHYPTFNAFFTRALRTHARPIDPTPYGIVSPCDGTISQIGKIESGRLLQAKGRYFTVDALLARHPIYTSQFQQGAFVCLYLSPKDYHRVHMPFEGTPVETQHVPGRLFSVNTNTVAQVRNIFARNERAIIFFETAIGPVAVILVGALIVGSIEILPVPPFSKEWAGGILNKGAEIGRFKLGSTVIVLFPKNSIDWEPQLSVGTSVIVGQLLGKIRA